jgi:hypothetical protein
MDLDRNNRAVAVMFDFVPLVFRRLVDKRQHHGDDEARRHERGHNLDIECRGCKGESA